MLTSFYLYCLDFPNGKKYIGLTRNAPARLARHRELAKSGFHLPVHAAIRKYGVPRHRVLCIGGRDYISDLEIQTIAAFRTTDRRFGYNVALGGDLNPTASPVVRAKISAALTGKHPSSETRAKLSIVHKGIRPSAETRAKTSAALKGRIISVEHRAKMSAALKGRTSPNKGKPRPIEISKRVKAARWPDPNAGRQYSFQF